METKSTGALKKSVTFPCPTCGKTITRELRHRKLSIEYTCSCGYKGP